MPDSISDTTGQFAVFLYRRLDCLLYFALPVFEDLKCQFNPHYNLSIVKVAVHDAADPVSINPTLEKHWILPHSWTSGTSHNSVLNISGETLHVRGSLLCEEW